MSTATQILAVLNLDETPEIKEALVEAAINKLNRHGAPTITNMAGTPGAKTVTLTSKQMDAVLDVARIIYASYYKNPDATQSKGISGLSISQTDLMSNATVLNSIKEIARCLRDDGELPYATFNELQLLEDE